MTRMGMLLKISREEMGMSQIELGQLLELKSSQYISNIERGLSPISPTHFKVLGKCLGLSIEELITVHLDDLHDRVRKQAYNSGDETNENT